MILKERCIIYAQDIMIFTGRSRSYAYKILAQVKEYHGKEKHQLVTFHEYAEFHGVPVSAIKMALFEKLNH